MKRWTHQETGLAQLLQAIANGKKRIVVTGPTGSGKTTQMFDFMAGLNEPAVLHTNRTMLMEQLSENMQQANLPHGLLAATKEPSAEDRQIAMLQTLVSRCVNRSRTVHPAKVIIWDEVHNMVADKSMQLRKMYGEGVVDVGYTATPLDLGHYYDHLIVAGRTLDLIQEGIIVPVHHFAPDEPDMKWIGTIKDDAECGIPTKKKRETYVRQFYGSIIQNYEILNRDKRPTLMFAPGVGESIYLCQQFEAAGYRAAHIDATRIWIAGEQIPRDEETVRMIRMKLEMGELDVVSNCQVMREGIDWPFISHMIFATVFGSLKSYLQSGGRGQRSSYDKQFCTCADHGGNWWRHGSLNTNRTWNIAHSSRQVMGARKERLRSGDEVQPWTCIKCNKVRTSGIQCPHCGHTSKARTRRVRTINGTLKETRADVYRKKRVASEMLKKSWLGYVKTQIKHHPDLSFTQVQNRWAYNNSKKGWGYLYPNQEWPCVPRNYYDWYVPISSVRNLS